MRYLFMVQVLCLHPFLTGCSDSKSNKMTTLRARDLIVGKWERVGNKDKGYSFEFRQDGTLSIAGIWEPAEEMDKTYPVWVDDKMSFRRETDEAPGKEDAQASYERASREAARRAFGSSGSSIDLDAARYQIFEEELPDGNGWLSIRVPFDKNFREIEYTNPNLKGPHFAINLRLKLKVTKSELTTTDSKNKVDKLKRVH